MFSSRLANFHDSKEIFSWRNDPITRKSFFNNNIVKRKEHEDWFNKMMKSDKSILIIHLIEKDKIGVVRFDVKNKETHVSINTNPKFRNKGFASKMLLESESYLSSNKRFPKVLVANIIKNNLSSIKVFKKAKYKLQSTEFEHFVYKKETK
tara:strand:+ start:1646 stop:2098 length:453 start_codon:yes stop_codon:yes gene_type:complete